MNDSEQDLAHRLYGGMKSIRSVYQPPVQHTIDRLGDRTGWDAEAKQGFADAVMTAYFDAGVDPQTGATLTHTIAHYVGEPADEPTQRTWEAESRRALRERFGSDADRRLAAARQFVAARPVLADHLNRSGAGSHPEVIVALAERIDSLRPPRTRK